MAYFNTMLNVYITMYEMPLAALIWAWANCSHLSAGARILAYYWVLEAFGTIHYGCMACRTNFRPNVQSNEAKARIPASFRRLSKNVLAKLDIQNFWSLSAGARILGKGWPPHCL